MKLTLSQFAKDETRPAQLAPWIEEQSKRVVEALLEVEVDDQLGRPSYSRDGDTLGSRNGYKMRWARLGESRTLVRLPQIRAVGTPYRSCLWRMLKRSCPTLDGLVFELAANGPSTDLFNQLLRRVCEHDAPLPISQPSLARLVSAFRAEHDRFRTKSLAYQQPVCLSIGTVAVTTIATRADEPKPLYLVCFAKCGNGDEQVLDVTRVRDRYDLCAKTVVTGLRQRGLPPPLLFGGVACPYLREFVSSIWTRRERQSHWDDVLRSKRSAIHGSVAELVKVGFRELTS